MISWYYLVCWKTPHVRTHTAARDAFFGQSKDPGSREDTAALVAGITTLIGDEPNVERMSGALMIRVSESEIRRIADSLRELVTSLGYVMFDPQCERLVVPAPRSSAAWPPDWAGPAAAVREAARIVPPDDDRGAYEEAFIGAVMRRTGGQILEPPATVRVPFAAPNGFSPPYLVPERLRTPRRLAAFVVQLESKRATTRRSAATLLGGWQGHAEAMGLLSRQLAAETDIYTRAKCALGLALSDAIEPVELVATAEDMTESAKTEADFDGVSNAILAAIIAVRNRNQAELEPRIARLFALIPDGEAQKYWWRSLRSLLESH